MRTSEAIDLDDELELEALRRMELQRDAVLFEGSFANSEAKRRRLFMGILLVTTLFYGVMAMATHMWFIALFPLILIAEYILLTHVTRKKFANRTSQVHISSLGLTVDMPDYRIGPVFWDEIAAVNVVNLGVKRYVRVRLKNPKATYDRALSVKPGRLSFLTELSLRQSNIEIIDQWFSHSAEEIAAQIVTFQPTLLNNKK